MRLCFTLLILTIAFDASAQTSSTSFDFTYLGQVPPPCNPFGASANFLHPWKVSHGSPQIESPYQDGSYYRVARLVGRFTQGEAKEKGEGLYIGYSFKANHNYVITFRVAHAANDVVGLIVSVANGLTEKSSNTCAEEERPTITDVNKVYEKDAVYDGLPGDTDTETISFKPTKDYAYLWFSSKQAFYGNSGSLLLDDIVITDSGTSTQPQPDPSCPSSPVSHQYSYKVTFPGGGTQGYGAAVAAHDRYFAVGADAINSVIVYKKTGCAILPVAVLHGDQNYTKYGSSVDIIDDALIVGDPTEGAAYIYRRTGEVWSLWEKLTPPSPQVGFGTTVGISEHSAVVGSPEENGKRGAVTFYSLIYPGGFWAQDLKMTHPTALVRFGKSLDMKANSVIVGSGPEDEGRGTVYMFNRSSGGSTAWKYTGIAYLDSPGEDRFGKDVALTDDGLVAFVSGGGEGGYDILASYRYNSNGGWQTNGHLPSPLDYVHNSKIDVRGNYLIALSMSSDHVYIRQHDGSGNWPVVTIANWNYSSHSLALDVAVGGDYFVVGNPERSRDCNYSGSIYLTDMFAGVNGQDVKICNKTYLGTLNTVRGRSITIAGTDGCAGVSYKSGAKAAYYANQIVLKPGFKAEAGSSIFIKAQGCAYGTSFNTLTSARVATPAPFNESAVPMVPSTPLEETAVNDPADKAISVYPNPVSDNRFFLKSKNEVMLSAEVYTIGGILLGTTQAAAGSDMEVSLKEDYHGVIIVKVQTKNGIRVLKVVRE